MHELRFERLQPELFLHDVLAEIAWVFVQVVVLNLDDAGDDGIQKLPVVRDDDCRAAEVAEPGFQPFNTGDKQSNLQLSRDRAQAVADMLVDLGIDEKRIKVEGYGDDYPVEANASERGRAQNRRVEIVFSDEKGQLGAAR